jgi:transposase
VNVLSRLLPDATNVRLETWSLEPASSIITLTLRARRITARCPLCGRRSKRVHSRYERTLADLPWGEYAVVVHLKVRRLFCDNAGCERRLFAERLPGVTAPRARKTARLAERLTAVGLALGGTAGARLGRELGLGASRNTLLRLVRRAPLPDVATPSALGVDDWALRKRHSYGTVLVDLERHRPVALLPDREADTLAAWLREHPGVEVIARDRSGAYARGARDGVPGAVQVADRFHLLQNLAEALQLVFTAHAHDLRAAEQARREAMLAEHGVVPLPPSEPQTKAKLLAAERRERRMARHAQVWALYRQGWSGEKIGPHLGIGRATVYRFLRSQAFPERKGRSDAGHSLLDPWRPLVLEHWDGDRRNSPELFRVLQRHGYRGSHSALVRYLRRLRTAQGIAAAPSTGLAATAQPRPSMLAAVPGRVLTPHTVAWLVLRRAEKRSADDQALLADLRRHAPELDEAVALAEAFAGLVRDHAADRLDPWLRRAGESGVRRLRDFAKRLSADYDAVRAAVTLDWSNGQAEGQINRLKTLKRQMYGRASFDLLERRFLLAA